jgi:hypothetical protein
MDGERVLVRLDVGARDHHSVAPRALSPTGRGSSRTTGEVNLGASVHARRGGAVSERSIAFSGWPRRSGSSDARARAQR